ncbi:pre-toxin TG domain-containing protein [Bacillus ndiopicus]|uniref:pre-toxin TG domain-containing protein n=1 Tax=Bacillus ndiopicus TaxID=1347368 RepID=UPI0006937EC0|nr:pre-toxin TG domain-containing protein [Bacillus ndiopicus]
MGKFWKSIGKAIASIPFVGNAIKSAKKGAQTIKKEAKKLAQKVETKLGELKESAEELLEELEESVEEALGKVTTYARKLKNNLDELALVQWLKKDAKTFVLAAYKKTKNWVKGGWKEGVSMIVDFCPGLGNLKGAYEAAYGKDPITGRKLSKAERAISGAAIIGGPFVKGAKHLGKGAMKIIPGSSKLADTLSKPLTKLKEGGKQVVEKVTAKAKELKAQANTAMAQMKQKIQTGMDKLGDMLNGNKPLLATAGANGMKTGAKKESDSLVQMSTNKSGGSEKGVTGNLKFTPDLENHIRNTDPSVPRRIGVGGAHNKDEFYKNEVNILNVERHPSMSGVEKITYQVPSVDGKTGEITGWKTTHFNKTVYDPKVVSDEQYIRLGKEAAKDASANGSLGREWVGYDSKGTKWRGYTKDGEVTSFYPEF